MMRHLDIAFERVAADCLRMILSEEGRGVHGICEADPRTPGAYGAFLASLDLIGGKKTLRITADYPLNVGRATAPKTLMKRAVQAALEGSE